MPDKNLPAKINLKRDSIEMFPERANLYPLSIEPFPTELYKVEREENGKNHEYIFFEKVPDSTLVEPTFYNMRQAIRQAILHGLDASEFPVHSRSSNAIVKKNLAPSNQKAIQIYPSFKWRIIFIGENYYLCLDHRLIVRSILELDKISKSCPSMKLNSSQRLLVKKDETWCEGEFVKIEGDNIHVGLDSDNKIIMPQKNVIPVLTRSQIMELAPSLKINPDTLEKIIKKLSFLTVSHAPFARLAACNDFAAQLTYDVFPISLDNVSLELDPEASQLKPPLFVVEKDLVEPKVSFDHIDQTKKAENIQTGLVQFGTYEKSASNVNVTLLATIDSKVPMENLVKRLNDGRWAYKGAEKTFGAKLILSDERKIICKNVEEYESALNQFIRTPARKETDVALVYLPKVGNTQESTHPYFKIKSFLLKEGIASQMVDKSTVANPDYRDLNLALNTFVKAGNTPWVLEEAIPEVDMFIGLSSSWRQDRRKNIRLMGYVNVFDSYGRWKFYQGDSQSFSFTERLKHYKSLIKNSIDAYKAESGRKLTNIHIHLTKSFSKIEREVICEAVREIEPKSNVVFVSINHTHPVRLYNMNSDDGSINRATYLIDEPSRIYLATTGKNIFNAKGMGTPIPLELTVWADPIEAKPSLKTIAQQILSLTRLNWGSSKSFCREPITTKYANDIAKKMTMFMDYPDFAINPILRNVPWFL